MGTISTASAKLPSNTARLTPSSRPRRQTQTLEPSSVSLLCRPAGDHSAKPFIPAPHAQKLDPRVVTLFPDSTSEIVQETS